jgi:hypothetical protein
MAILIIVAGVWAALASLAAAAKSDISYPATIEIDILFPRNETYNSNYTGMPIVLALQNAQAAYAYEWNIHWRIYGASASAGSIPLRGLAKSDEFDFQYYSNNVAVVPMIYDNAISLHKGTFRLEWDYATTPCIPEGKTAISQTRTPIASGTSYFSVVTDGSGLDFDIPIDKCPSFGDSWGVKSDEGCPAANTESDKPDPCAARLTSRDQVTCIWDYFTGKNETQTCLSAFKKADPDWPLYYTPGSRGNRGNTTADDTGNPDIENPDGEDDSSGSDKPDTPSTDDSQEDAGVSHRPVLSGLAFAVLGAVVMAL